MERRFPWWWTESRIELLVAGVCVLCAAFAAPAFVTQVIDSDMYNPRKNGLPLVISTALWAWGFRRVLWKRNLAHAFWVAPLFGALNAGTTLGLSTLVAGFRCGSERSRDGDHLRRVGSPASGFVANHARYEAGIVR